MLALTSVPVALNSPFCSVLRRFPFGALIVNFEFPLNSTINGVGPSPSNITILLSATLQYLPLDAEKTPIEYCKMIEFFPRYTKQTYNTFAAKDTVISKFN